MRHKRDKGHTMRKKQRGSLVACLLAGCLVLNISTAPLAMAEGLAHPPVSGGGGSF